MGPEVLVIFVMLMVAPMALVALMVSWWMVATDRRELETLWERYAKRRRFTFVPARGEWPNRTPPVVSWTEGETRYRLEAIGAEAFVRTSVVARPRIAAFGTFALRRIPRSPPRERDATVTGAAVTGDALIDAHFVVEARPSALLSRCLTPELTRALIGFEVGERGSLTYERGDVQLSWGGGESNDARLDEARAVVRQVIRALG